MTLLDGLAEHLADNGIGVYEPPGEYATPYAPTDVGIVIGTMPQAPTRAIALAQYGGPEAPITAGMDSPQVQIRVRGDRDPDTSRSLAQAAYDLLHGAEWLTLPTGDLIELAVGVQSGPVHLGADASGRHEHVVNVRLHVTNPNR